MQIKIKTFSSNFQTYVFTLIICLFSSLSPSINAQSIKSGINFQAVARDIAGNPANNRKIYIESTILKGGPNGVVVFGEHHESKTNEYGIFNIIIGKGSRYEGVNDIYSIDWANANYYFHLKIAITPVSPDNNWDFNKEWIDLGAVEFGVVPYAIQSFSSNGMSFDTAILNRKLNIADTSIILSPYALKIDLTNGFSKKLNTADTASMLLPYRQSIRFADSNFYVTPFQFSLKTFDTTHLSNRIDTKLYKADTLLMLTPYLRQSQFADGMKTKLNLSDTILMLSPYLRQSQLATYTNLKLNIADTSLMLSTYLKQHQIAVYLQPKLNTLDTSNMLIPYLKQSQLAAYLNNKLNITDTASMLNARFQRDTTALSARINFKEDVFNKSVNVGLVGDYNDFKYPSVKAIKDYVDAALIAGAPDATTTNKGLILLAGDLTGSAVNPIIANNAIVTSKLQDASVTDAKLAAGINASKVGLGNVTNNAQLYNLNGLTAQTQSFSTPGVAGLSPNWISTGADHTLNIPLAASNSVTAGLISKSDYDHFSDAYLNIISNITNNGNNGVASITNNVLNIPTYSLIGLSGNVNANNIFAGPSSGAAGAAGFRSLVAADIPNNAANTSGNASTASKLYASININNISFDGSSDILLTANTSNALTFSSSGLGAIPGSGFNGSVAREVSYNTIGAAPAIGSINMTTLGNISTGTWAANVIAANYGGAGSNNGILKADGTGLVSVATAGSDFQAPLNFTAPILNTSNTISIPQASSVTNGYLTNTDWTGFNNKIDLSQKAAVNGVASLDGNGKIPTSQIPSISFSSGYVVTNETAMLALSNAVIGSIAIRTDNSKNYVLSGLPASTLGNWLELLMPVSIASVNGYTQSSITLTSTDISEGTNLYFSNARARNVISATSPLSYASSTGIISLPVASGSAAGYLSATDWNLFNSKIGAFSAQPSNSFYAGPGAGINASPSFRSIVVADIPVLNQNTTGNAGTATKLAATKNINGVPFDGSANITIYSNVPSPITFDDSGLGGITTTTFNGSVAKTISYNTIGAAPALGSNSIVTLGSITTGTWLGSVIDANHGGAGTVTGILKANGSGTVIAATAGADFESPLIFSLPLSRTSNTISLSAATSTANGYLTSTDWSLFNGKQSTLVAGTGVSISGGNTVSIGQTVATSASPSFAGITLSGLNVAGIVTNTAGGLIGTTTTTGTGNIVRANTPTLITPILGDASATSLNTGTITATSINASSDVTAKRYKLTMPSNITATATTNIDLSTGNVFTVNMGLNITSFTFTNAGVGTYLIKFVQDATGTRDISFPAAWKWAGGIIPSLTNTANKLDIVTLIYDGTTFYATIVQNF